MYCARVLLLCSVVALSSCGTVRPANPAGTPTAAVTPTPARTPTSGGATGNVTLTGTAKADIRGVSVTGPGCETSTVAQDVYLPEHRDFHASMTGDGGWVLDLVVEPYTGPGTYTSAVENRMVVRIKRPGQQFTDLRTRHDLRITVAADERSGSFEGTYGTFGGVYGIYGKDDVEFGPAQGSITGTWFC